MLIRFRVKNYLSYKEEACLSLVPSRVRTHKHHVFVDSTDRKSIPVLRAAFIYGANASGKSNLIKAMASAQRFIRGEKRSGVPKPSYYRLDSLCHGEPTEYSFDFKINQDNYEYGFHMLAGNVVKEWLNSVTKETEKLIFERSTIDGNSLFKNGKHNLPEDEQQFLEFTQKGTADTKLFLTECKDRNFEKNVELKAIQDALDWFLDKLMVVFPNTTYGGLEANLNKDAEFANPFLKILKMFDTGVDSLELTEVDHENAIPDLPKELIDDIAESLEPKSGGVLISSMDNTRYFFRSDKRKDLIASKVTTGHVSNGGKLIQFDLSEESDGTRRLLDLIPGMLAVMLSEKVLVIDEFDRSLHPDITYSFITSFLNNIENLSSQLILTSHDRGLLSNDLVRKDEVWFIQKNAQGESTLYSLDEFSDIRANTDVRKGYQLGRYGGVPIITTFTADDLRK